MGDQVSKRLEQHMNFSSEKNT